ncbi:GNAT family N-acetyltransferase [Pseudochrobactrum sp. HB0163]|uniref:GNAT family N-acetyltransferase n=1 Tax=Pseudochrobactrum sp. HB0163 TaxID=3450708 RepID=UPI003F6DBF91
MAAISFTLRQLDLQEMAQASRIHRASFDDRLPWLKGLHTPQEDQWFYENCIFPQCEVWAAFAPEMAGIIAFKQGWIEQLYILPGFQGHGIGSALLKQALNRFSHLQLWTFQRNMQARKFYEKHNFIAVETSDGSRNEEKEPDMRYEYKIPAPDFK